VYHPSGLRGNQIPAIARIMAVIDVWDALTSERPYRQAWTHQRTRQYLQTHAGTLFDPRIVVTFLEFLEHPKKQNYQH
jgi:HD-GYP domain-containing protein (c-di-GMP phosphodiesterase class II)